MIAYNVELSHNKASIRWCVAVLCSSNIKSFWRFLETDSRWKKKQQHFVHDFNLVILIQHPVYLHLNPPPHPFSTPSSIHINPKHEVEIDNAKALYQWQPYIDTHPLRRLRQGERAHTCNINLEAGLWQSGRRAGACVHPQTQLRFDTWSMIPGTGDEPINYRWQGDIIPGMISRYDRPFFCLTHPCQLAHLY